MTDQQLRQYDKQRVRVTLADGTQLEGTWDVTRETGYYHLWPKASDERAQNYSLSDIKAGDVESVEPLEI